MTREEICEVLNSVAATWSNFKWFNKDETVKAWMLWLAPYQKDAVLQAVQVYGLTSGEKAFAPSPNVLAAMINQQGRGQLMTEGDAWQLVNKAIKRGIYHAAEEFDKLPEAVREAVGSASQIESWAQIDLDSLTVVESNFKRNYRTVTERKTKYDGLSDAMRERLMVLETIGIGVKGNE